jgi:hypothetical protein
MRGSYTSKKGKNQEFEKPLMDQFDKERWK